MTYKIFYTGAAQAFQPLYIETEIPEEMLEGIICALQYFYEALHDLEPLSDKEHLLNRGCLIRILTEFYDAKDVTNRFIISAAGTTSGINEPNSTIPVSLIRNDEPICIDWYEAIDFWGWSASSRYDCIRRHISRERTSYEKIRNILYEESL